MTPRTQHPDGTPPRPDDGPELETGLLLQSDLDPGLRDLVLRAAERARAILQRELPMFTWRFPTRRILIDGSPQRIEPTDLLDQGVQDRDLAHWDFAIVITEADLRSYYQPSTMAVSSRAVDVAVLSLARLHPSLTDEDATDDHHSTRLIDRITTLLLHLLCDLNGVAHCEHPEHCTWSPASARDLDRMSSLCPERRERLVDELTDIADLRLEEATPTTGRRSLWFALRAIWINLDDIANSVARARPWEFPLRLGRVTAAALSALVVLLLTAEVWELGGHIDALRVVLLSTASLLGATGFVVARHRLLGDRRDRHLTEQVVTSNTTMTVVVLMGFATTYALLWALALGVTAALFDPELVQSWTGRDLPRWRPTFAGFVASVGILVGALGTSFEGRYFRHVAFIDEET